MKRVAEGRRAVLTSAKLYDLQVMRGVAATMVVVDHAIDFQISRGLVDEGWRSFAYLAGWLGVGVFFATSGFIMYVTSSSGSGVAATRRFLVRRVLRVVPLYWLMTGVAVVAFRDFDLWNILRSLFFIPYAVPGATVMRPVLGVGWSLNYEMFFYVLLAVGLMLGRRAGALIVSVVLIVLVAVGAATGAVPKNYADPVTFLAFYMDPILLLFVAGLAVGALHVRGYLRYSTSLLVPAVALLACLLLIGGLTGIAFPLSWGSQAVLGAGCVAVLACCLGWRRAEANVHPPIYAVLVKCGDGSFSTYLTHVFVLLALREAWMVIVGSTPVWWSSGVFVLFGVISCNAVGWVSFRTVERPLTRFLSARAPA